LAVVPRRHSKLVPGSRNEMKRKKERKKERKKGRKEGRKKERKTERQKERRNKGTRRARPILIHPHLLIARPRRKVC